MSSKNLPYRHEIKSKNKTQVVRDKTKEVSKKEQKAYLIQMIRDAEELGLYDDIDDVFNEESHRSGSKEGGNFMETQIEYKG